MKINLSKEFIKTQIRDLVLMFIISTLTLYLTCDKCFLQEANTSKYVWFSFLMWIIFWKGNELCTNLVSNRISWVEKPLRRFIIGMIAMLAYTSFAIFVLQYLSFLAGISKNMLPSINNFIMPLIYTSGISLTLHSIMFLKSWRQAEITMEKLKNERLASQYEALKNQVNPHFLFNSLNALTSLVYEDQDQAVKFIQQLSKVYRYVLDNREKEIVPLDTEIEFVNSYLFLQKIRYGENLKFTIDLPASSKFMVAPLSVQMLIENAIKHNVISSEEPLSINIYSEDNDYLIIRNNLQVKNIINEYSGIGLENIKARYIYFTKKEVIIEKTNSEFIVRLPLINQSKEKLQEVMVEVRDYDRY
jgi:sensor histidine kinase YesM